MVWEASKRKLKPPICIDCGSPLIPATYMGIQMAACRKGCKGENAGALDQYKGYAGDASRQLVLERDYEMATGHRLFTTP